MIPKKIHYCWFGGKELPASARKCVASWRRFFPDYEIVEWNEDNFDVNAIAYTSQAYAAGKFAFVSDYARFKILCEHGGVYFDTDVEVIRPMHDIIARGPFMGFEINPGEARPEGAVNPGVGMAAVPEMDLYRTILDYYEHLNFIMPDGSHNITDAVVNITTREMVRAGLKDVAGIQTAADIVVYPADYFNPFDDATGRLNKTHNTRTIHWYSKTWLDVSPWRQRLSRLAHRLFGVDAFAKFRSN